MDGEAVEVGLWSKADIGASPINVRCTPKSGHWNLVSQRPLRGKSELMHCGNRQLFDRLVGRAVRIEGLQNSNVLAVCRLMSSGMHLAAHSHPLMPVLPA